MKSSEKTFTAIVETAYRMFSEYGIAKTTYSMIAEEVGISKPSIYYYFKSKEELINYIFEEVCKAIEFSAFFTLKNFTKDNFKDELVAVGFRMIEEQAKDKHFNRVIQEYLLLASRNKKYIQRFEMVQQEFLVGFEDLLKRGSDLGVTSSVNVHAKAHMLAMILDNIGNFMLLDVKIDYKQVWIEAVATIIRDEV
ncbi:TetR/AcrR family transcriptional regulator [Sporosarcina limicola]|uniref:AcrR family transcriptional regulator n=1 Tax=Sporosarcina limicola TaxID=34101 RepID=A0A927RGN5_9BACL|nr:TetR/AcrR family transcriptional regulator [Sporosarcina limicola]MBE1556682.1 AcrR family transcriptional regulator [Sporosarcina limicola]